MQPDPDKAAIRLRRTGFAEIALGAPATRLVGDAVDDGAHATLPAGSSPCLSERRLYTLGMERQIANALSRRVREGIGDRRDGRPLRALASAERPFGGTVDQLDRDL